MVLGQVHHWCALLTGGCYGRDENRYGERRGSGDYGFGNESKDAGGKDRSQRRIESCVVLNWLLCQYTAHDRRVILLLYYCFREYGDCDSQKVYPGQKHHFGYYFALGFDALRTGAG